jgi:MacB-like periplasmic core domain
MVDLVSDGYFETMRIPLVRGRTFGAAERSGGPNAIILNARLAAQLFDDGENPVGKHLVVEFGAPCEGEIVGVVGDVRSYGPANAPPGTLYFPAWSCFRSAAPIRRCSASSRSPWGWRDSWPAWCRRGAQCVWIR